MFFELGLASIAHMLNLAIKFACSKMLDYSKMNVVIGAICCLYRDAISFLLFFKFKFQLTKQEYFGDTVIRQFERIVEKQPNKIAFNYQDEIFRFVDIYRLSNRVANWAEKTLMIGRSEEHETCKVNGNKKAIKLESVKYDSGDKVQATETTNIELSDDNSDCFGDQQIGLMLGNIPEMGAFMLGIARVRACSVLFNTNHRADALKNAFLATKCRAFVFESKFLPAFREIADDLPNIPFFMYDRSSASIYRSKSNNAIKLESGYKGFSKFDLKPDSGKELENFAPILARYSELLPTKKYTYKFTDNLMYIFTSGTTGGRLKATPQNNYRYIVGYMSVANAFWLRSRDNFFISQPLYHSLAAITGLSQCFIGGSTVSLADKFSASKFWIDCKRYQCTVAFYIGETARYLLAQPHRPEEQNHSLRMMIGIGMKKEVWTEFTERFNVPKIAEFYGSSEGNVNLFNTQNVVGSCGFIPYYFGPIIRFLFPIFLIKVDPITLEPIRDRNGRCKFASAGDTGLLVGAIRPNIEYTKFLGYTSKQETSKKVIRNIVSADDCGFSSGDLVEMDLYGNLYFKDRTGDTFRWKGENVSTTEVEAVAAQFLNQRDCTVYGVTIPNTDGCAGMIAIKLDDTNNPACEPDLDLMQFYLQKRLPEYALPKFVRLTDQIETTSTHKIIKYRLRQQGYNPNSPPAVSNLSESLKEIQKPDKFFYWNKQTKRFIQIDQDIYDDIQNGNVQF